MGRKDKYTTIWWEADDAVNVIYYCNYCRQPVTRIYGKAVMHIPGDVGAEPDEDGGRNRVLKTPVTVKCSGRMYGHACPYVYVFQGFTTNDA